MSFLLASSSSQVVDKYGKLDVLVNNAAIQVGPFAVRKLFLAFKPCWQKGGWTEEAAFGWRLRQQGAAARHDLLLWGSQ
jgi:NAD(P)-dependent dehydrogenase (short-subunit alcohol dehydrogenase family)